MTLRVSKRDVRLPKTGNIINATAAILLASKYAIDTWAVFAIEFWAVVTRLAR
jgi:hypothetical protein